MFTVKDLLAGLRQSCAELLDPPFEIKINPTEKAALPENYRIWGAFLLVLLCGIIGIVVAVLAKLILPPVGAAAVFGAFMLVLSEVKDSGKAGRKFSQLFAGWTRGRFDLKDFLTMGSDSEASDSESITAFWLLGLVKFLLFAYIAYSGKFSLVIAFFAADFLSQLWLIYAENYNVKAALYSATLILLIFLMFFHAQVVFFSAVGIVFVFRSIRKIELLPPEGVTLVGTISGWIVLLLSLIFAV